MCRISILHIAIANPFRYLSGNSTKFTKYGWTTRYNSKVLDTVETVLIEI